MAQIVVMGGDVRVSAKGASPAFGAEAKRVVPLAATFLIHVHEGDQAGMRSILDEINSSGLASEFVAAMAAVAVGLGRRLCGEEELGRVLREYAMGLDRESSHDDAPDSP